jgi:polar amino acid transport system substrate-binding protein
LRRARKIAGPQKQARQTLAQKRVGVIEGTAHEAMLRDWFPDIKPVTFSRHEWMFDALKTGSVLMLSLATVCSFSFWLASRSAEECCGFLDGPYVSRAHLGEGLAIAVSPRNARLACGF